MNTTFQRSNERAPVYELPPIHTLAKKNISNMNTQSSPGFDPFSASFIKHAEETVRDDCGKRHTEIVLLPLLTDLFHLFLSDGITPHLWNKVKITPLHKKGNYVPQKLSFAGYQWLYLNLLQTWSGTC